MKKLLLFIFIFVEVSLAQNVMVTEVKQITTLEQGKFFHPVSNYDDTKILLSSENYKGLWLLDNATGVITQINDFNGAGYEAGFTKDGGIIFRKDNFINNRRFISVYKYNPITKNLAVVSENLRGISEIKIVNGESVFYSKENQIVEYSVNDKLNKTETDNLPVLVVENSDLVLYRNGEREVLNPLGEGNYLWASVSPDGNKLLFTFAGVGSFVTNLDGEVITELGYAHYPQWSKDGKWIVFMKDYDDGERITDSELFVSSVDGKVQANITKSKDVYEMYPQWSKTEDVIYCNSTDGIIYKIELKFN